MRLGHKEEVRERDGRAWDRWLNVNMVDVHEGLCEPRSALNLKLQVVEIGDGIRFGPKSDLTGCEGLIA